ncbi:hypothetical protein [Variovorax sp. YR752]|uniref:hypothetical protein n=1 Tax=Variovorax sp. YR752 TaxID=1884383 RepID=UPI0031377CB2
MERKKILAEVVTLVDIPRQQMATAVKDASSWGRLVPFWCRMNPVEAVVTAVAFVIVATVYFLMIVTD